MTVSSRAKAAAVPGFDPSASYKFHYEHKSHKKLPHVVKFSGGRSSGMLLFLLLQNGMLDAKRGDVVIFNNTSAEHPETYKFADKCKRAAEEEYGIPFFWLEYQTYEDAVGGEWKRVGSYKLVNTRPHSAKNPCGYKSHGEVFEELLSQQSYVPNQHRRTCTAAMKVQTTEGFLKDWFAVKTGIGHCGHYYGKSMMTTATLEKMHRKNGGRTPLEVLAEKKEFVMSCPPHRPAQQFADFTSASINILNSKLTASGGGGRAALSGDKGVEHLLFVGIRADEPRRVAKMLGRNRSDSPGEESSGHEYAPLAAMGVCRENIIDFWKKQPWGLNLPDNKNLSNCVFCFLKGPRQLANIAAHQKPGVEGRPLSPSDIRWWSAMEKKYGRDLVREQRDIKTASPGERPIIGFFGMNAGVSFEKIAGLSQTAAAQKDSSGLPDSLPCDCTD